MVPSAPMLVAAANRIHAMIMPKPIVSMVLGLLSPDVDMSLLCAWDCAGIALPSGCR